MTRATVGLGLALAFAVGCGAGIGSSAFVARPAQAATSPGRWEYSCFTEQDTTILTDKANQMGAQGAELASTAAMTEKYWRDLVWCFKRPLP